MKPRRVGIWLVGAFGGVGTTVALGIAALKRGLIGESGLVTALESLRRLDLDAPGEFIVGGHDIRRSSFEETVRGFQKRSGVFDAELVNACADDLREWSQYVRPGTVQNAGETIARLADWDIAQGERGRVIAPRAIIDQLKKNLSDFRTRHSLDQIVVVSVASTEPPFETGEVHQDVSRLNAALSDGSHQSVLPASSLYAWAALELGLAYVNFTPSLGATFPAAEILAKQTGSVVAGQDGKTGETLLKSVLAPMFLLRNLKVLSWVGHNIFGNRDGLVLDDPRNKQSKVRTKDQIVSQILGYKPQTHVSIEYIESLDDWKTAWDHLHFEGFLGVKMMMQFTWQGCDSILAAPLVIDLARLALFAQSRGEAGVLRHLACFFKNPMGVEESDFFKQMRMLEEYAV